MHVSENTKIKQLKEIWKKLDEDIYQDEKNEQNLKTIKYCLLIFGLIMVFFVVYNHIQGRTVAEVACLILGLTMFASAFIFAVTRNRRRCGIVIAVLTGVVLTIFTFDGTNDGFAILWSLLLPAAIMFLFNVKIGLIQVICMELVFVIAFYTPLRGSYLTGKYTETFMNRWPILYGTAVAIFSVAMIGYHLNALGQLDYDSKLQEEIAKQTAKSAKRRIMVEKLSEQMVEALVQSIDAKDTYTNGHSRRVEKYSIMIAQKSGLFSENDLLSLRYTAILHDIGKIGIPDEIINKPGKLTDEEYSIIKTHPSVGGEILSNIDAMPGIMVGARWHHEHYDGTGYPDGLKGEDIPLVARVIAVADAYDAMTSNRSYRKYLPQEKVRAELENGKNKQFDPILADIMIQIIDEDKDYILHE